MELQRIACRLRVVICTVVILPQTYRGSTRDVKGMMLQVPITVMMVNVLAQFDNTRWLAVLLSDKGRVNGKEDLA